MKCIDFAVLLYSFVCACLCVCARRLCRSQPQHQWRAGGDPAQASHAEVEGALQDQQAEPAAAVAGQ